jgi:hypothetical protein
MARLTACLTRAVKGRPVADPDHAFPKNMGLREARSNWGT